MPDRGDALTSGEAEPEPVALTCERRVAGKDFEIQLHRDGLDWRWEARLSGEDSVWASGTVTNQERVTRAVTVIAWKLFDLIVKDADYVSEPDDDAGGSQGQSQAPRIGKARKTVGSPSTDNRRCPGWSSLAFRTDRWRPSRPGYAAYWWVS
jgi:hypothetical protein